jgi:hypothetical protein
MFAFACILVIIAAVVFFSRFFLSHSTIFVEIISFLRLLK